MSSVRYAGERKVDPCIRCIYKEATYTIVAYTTIASNWINQMSVKPDLVLRNEAICTCLAVRQGTRQITSLYDRHLANAGLRVSQFAMLMKLSRLGPLTMSDLASSMVMDRTTLTRTIMPMQKSGWIKSLTGEDRRTRRLEISSSGRKRLQAAKPHWEAAQKEFDRLFGVAAARELRSTMWRVVTTTSA